MTGRETLQMYARFRGIPERYVPAVVKNLIDTIGQILLLTSSSCSFSLALPMNS